MIDYERDNLLTDFGKTTLKDRYLLPEETFITGFKGYLKNITGILYRVGH